MRARVIVDLAAAYAIGGVMHIRLAQNVAQMLQITR
jgi:hypothetical protein